MKKVNLAVIFVMVLGMADSSAKMQAGKYYKKVTGEKLPEDGLVETETVLAIADEIRASKTSKYKETVVEIIDIIGEDKIPESWYEAKQVKAKESKEKSVENAVKLTSKLAKIKVIAEEDGLEDILAIINE